MALKYIANNATYDFSGPQYTTVSNKYRRLNYIAGGKTYQLGLATDSTAAQYSPLKMKIDDSAYYIGRSTSTMSSIIQSMQTTNLSHYTYSYRPMVEYYSFVLTTMEGKNGDQAVHEIMTSSRMYRLYYDRIPVDINDITYYGFTDWQGYYANFTGYITSTATFYINGLTSSSDYNYRTISTIKTISTSSSASSNNFV